MHATDYRLMKPLQIFVLYGVKAELISQIFTLLGIDKDMNTKCYDGKEIYLESEKVNMR